MTIDAGTIDGGTTDLIGVCAAARELRRHHSTVSRYVKSHPELNHGTDKRPKVDLDELRRHHDETTNAARRGSHAGRLFGEGAEDGEDDIAGAGDGDKPTDKLTYARAKAASIAEDVARKRRERHEAEGLLLPKAAVEDAFFACGRRVRRKVEMIEHWAEELAAAAGGDAAALRAALRVKLHAFQTDLAEAVKALPGAEDDEEIEPMPDPARAEEAVSDHAA